ncbi:SDR family NAD(P)-dependent oxidoreductase [Robbsia sp. KACC 23696]|uniref:SDR family NAD(P)-dependent oxidoreductase n=1 Tax=Robbsia sp. KACC 23696 TaxID=3149231 RepID=UPI00325ACA02
MHIRFDNQTVAITGAGIGIGRAIAARFVALGARVYGCDYDAAALTESTQSGFTGHVVDLTDRAAAASWIGDVEKHSGGPIGILINCAGGVAGQANKPLDQVSDEEWNRIIDVNLGAAFAVSRAAVGGMKQAGKGAIVNISSSAALRASLTGIQAYCAAKHGVLGLTRQLAHELGAFGIRVNSVAPGLIISNAATERQWAAYGAAKQAQMLDAISMKRLGKVDDIVDAVMFFASDMSSFVNGQVLSVDGGKAS